MGNLKGALARRGPGLWTLGFKKQNKSENTITEYIVLFPFYFLSQLNLMLFRSY
uniref:Uncharacterized protein n=1 Tax=Octopus bimaculoides TaxID=37653 RepID=A0A0L8FUS7_OCTBM